LDAAIKFAMNPYLVRQGSAYLKGGHSCSLVLRAHVLLEHSQGNPMSTQVAADQLDVHPELTEDNGLGQALALLLGRLQHSMQSFALTLACVTERTVWGWSAKYNHIMIVMMIMIMIMMMMMIMIMIMIMIVIMLMIMIAIIIMIMIMITTITINVVLFQFIMS